VLSESFRMLMRVILKHDQVGYNDGAAISDLLLVFGFESDLNRIIGRLD
jgi:hypothetical protein